jgi:hypothetical protein
MKLEQKQETTQPTRKPNGLRVYDDTITIVVSVDAIATKFHKAIDKSNPHAVLITEAVIGTAIQNRTLETLYNALNGFTGDIDFATGDLVYSTKKISAYKLQDTDWVRAEVEIGVCQIVDIDLYKNQKVLIQFQVHNSRGEARTEKEWVNHTTLTEPTDEQMHLAGFQKEEVEQN